MKTANAWTRWDRPELAGFTFHTHVNCDECGAVETRASWTADTPEMEAERRRAAEEQAQAKGWSISDGHRCPACVAKAAGTAPEVAPIAPQVFVDGTAPGTLRVVDATDHANAHGCDGKTPYVDLESALAAAKRRSPEAGPLRAYFCDPGCHSWHLSKRRRPPR